MTNSKTSATNARELSLEEASHVAGGSFRLAKPGSPVYDEKTKTWK